MEWISRTRTPPKFYSNFTPLWQQPAQSSFWLLPKVTTGIYTYKRTHTHTHTHIRSRYKAWVCCCSIARTAGSNPSGYMDLSLVGVKCCEVEVPPTGQSHVQEFYRLWCMSVTLTPRQYWRSWPTKTVKTYIYIYIYMNIMEHWKRIYGKTLQRESVRVGPRNYCRCSIWTSLFTDAVGTARFM